MSLIQRKPRPLIRDAASFRDDRLFIIACDDTYAPKQYFDMFRIPRLQIHVIPATDGKSSAAHVLAGLQDFNHEPDDERWMLLDTDHFVDDTHVKAFIDTIKKAKQQRINVAVSKPCFELWLLLHHEEESAVASLSNAAQVEIALRKKLGSYNKTNLRKEDYPSSFVAEACQRAERLDKITQGGDIPSNNTTRVYLLWLAIVSKALFSQLPGELAGLLRTQEQPQDR